MKISFIVPAYNEEKRIGMALDNLARLKKIYPDIEVLVGNDGSTDNTEEVVCRYDFIRYFRFMFRRGKHFVIDELIKFATGDIIAIHDADRIFNCKGGELEKLLDCFKDSRIGGIGDYYTTTYDENVVTSNNALYLGDAWNTLFMLEYKIKNLPCKLYVDYTKSMFYVNFFRKELAEETKTLCDDGERGLQLLTKDYRIRLLGIEKRPNFKTVYNKMSFWGFFKTKVRGFIAQKQIDDLYGSRSKPSIYMFIYILKNLHRVKRLKALWGMFIWWLAVILARIKYQFINKNITTKEGWKMRMK